MRAMLLLCLLAAANPALAQMPPATLPPPRAAGAGERLFISPMGEPFRSARGGPDANDMWFDGADSNHDKALTRAEFQADALRFFAALDRRHDGEIDPDDIDYYEGQLVPEIRVGSSAIDMPTQGDEGAARPSYPERQGAARYGYFSFPEPIMAADSNYNRGVDLREFAHAADARFDVLDKNGDGRIDRDELPRITPPRADSSRRAGRGGGERHGGRPRDGGSERQPF